MGADQPCVDRAGLSRAQRKAAASSATERTQGA